MKKEKIENTSLTFHPLTKDRWEDIEKLFCNNRSCTECWCMWYKLKRSIFDEQKGNSNKKAFKKIVSANVIPGIIAYSNNEPVGWCAIEPRENYPVLENSRLLKRIDDKPVWSIVCFFIAKDFRMKGITVELIKAALNFAKNNNAKIVEAYPIEPRPGIKKVDNAYHGVSSAFIKAGFQEVKRNSATRPIMRYYI